jgi:hypothetical protein
LYSGNVAELTAGSVADMSVDGSDAIAANGEARAVAATPA